MTRKITFRSVLYRDGNLDRSGSMGAQAFALPDTEEGKIAAAFLYWSSATQDKHYENISRGITAVYVDIDLDTMEAEVRYAV